MMFFGPLMDWKKVIQTDGIPFYIRPPSRESINYYMNDLKWNMGGWTTTRPAKKRRRVSLVQSLQRRKVNMDFTICNLIHKIRSGIKPTSNRDCTIYMIFIIYSVYFHTQIFPYSVTNKASR